MTVFTNLTRDLRIVLTALAIAPAMAGAATICVDPAGNGCQTTVQAGIDTATAGDTVDIHPATYFETVIVDYGKDGLILDGTGATIDGRTTGGTLLEIRSNGVVVNGLTLQSTDGDGIVIGDDSGYPTGTQIIGVTVTGVSFSCIGNVGADNTLISDVSLFACGEASVYAGSGGDSGGSDGLVIEATTAQFAGESGIVIIGDNASVTGSSVSHVTQNEALRIDGSNAVVAGNKISNVGTVGILVTGDHATVEKNKVSGADSSGIEVSGNLPTVAKNKLTFTRGLNVYANPCDGGSVIGNKVSDTKEDSEGIEAQCSSGTGGLLVSKNKVVRAEDDCFELFGELMTITGNKASACGGDSYESGFEIDADNSLISGNSASGASEDGFLLYGSNNTVTGNKAKGNYSAGFAAEGDSFGNLFAENSASGNTGAGFAVRGEFTEVTLTANSSSKNTFPLCQEYPTSTIADGMGNSFSLAMPPLCPYNR